MQEKGLSIIRMLCLHPRQFSICKPALLLQRLKYFCLVSGHEPQSFQIDGGLLAVFRTKITIT